MQWSVCVQFQLTEMRLTAEESVREREFYYGKLREIEILCQTPRICEDSVSGCLNVREFAWCYFYILDHTLIIWIPNQVVRNTKEKSIHSRSGSSMMMWYALIATCLPPVDCESDRANSVCSKWRRGQTDCSKDSNGVCRSSFHWWWRGSWPREWNMNRLLMHYTLVQKCLCKVGGLKTSPYSMVLIAPACLWWFGCESCMVAVYDLKSSWSVLSCW